MELTDSFLTLLQSFDPVFTAPTYQTFVVIITGWILSQRHRYVTEVIFSSGRVGDGPVAVSSLLQPRRLGHRHLLLALAKLVVTILAPAPPSSGPSTTPSVEMRADPRRRRHPLRPPHLQLCEFSGQLGTRLGRADPDRRLPRLGTVQVLPCPSPWCI